MVCDVGDMSWYLLPVKMSRPVMFAFAWPCLPVLDVVISTTCIAEPIRRAPARACASDHRSRPPRQSRPITPAPGALPRSRKAPPKRPRAPARESERPRRGARARRPPPPPITQRAWRARGPAPPPTHTHTHTLHGWPLSITLSPFFSLPACVGVTREDPDSAFSIGAS